MRRPVLLALLTAMFVVPAAAVVPAVSLAAPGAPPPVVQHQLHRACGAPSPGAVACNAVVNVPVAATGEAVPQAVTPQDVPAGYGPADLQSAYKLPSATAGGGQTVAIIDAYDNPKAESDLAAYRSQFGLGACTTDNGCFRKVGQFGNPVLPAPDAGWAAEISLDLDMVSATCPNCKILLVEANDPGIINIGFAVNTAVSLGATVISNSYTSTSSIFDFLLDFFFYNHPGVPSTASSGDNGFGVGYPAASQFVTAVGGTSLNRTQGPRGWTETAWAGSGSGCAVFDGKPPAQHDPGCGSRTVADVSAVADPNTGVAVYDTYNQPGWGVFGGTSASAPIIAGTYALAGNGRTVNNASQAYSHPESLFDVMSGSNGSCGGSYLCTSGPGFDGPTGLGTPNGVGAF